MYKIKTDSLRFFFPPSFFTLMFNYRGLKKTSFKFVTNRRFSSIQNVQNVTNNTIKV